MASGTVTQLLLPACNFLGVARRARKKKSDRWNDVFAQCLLCGGPHGRKTSAIVAAIVPRLSRAAAVARRKTEMKRSKIESQCLKGNAGKRREFGCGIKTRVRLPQQVFCTDRGEAVSRKGASVLSSSSYGTWGDGTAKARKTPKAPKITARITAGAAGSWGE